MTEAALASLYSDWKLPRWFDELTQLVDRHQEYGHYTEEQYKLPEIYTVKMIQQLAFSRDDAIAALGSRDMVGHIVEPKHNDELPDHFSQIYFDLAEACINALEQNDESKLNKVLPMFLSLAFLAADSKFTDSSRDVNNEFRLDLISTVIDDLAPSLRLCYPLY